MRFDIEEGINRLYNVIWVVIIMLLQVDRCDIPRNWDRTENRPKEKVWWKNVRKLNDYYWSLLITTDHYKPANYSTWQISIKNHQTYGGLHLDSVTLDTCHSHSRQRTRAFFCAHPVRTFGPVLSYNDFEKVDVYNGFNKNPNQFY